MEGNTKDPTQARLSPRTPRKTRKNTQQRYWSKEEHRLFLDGLGLYGLDAKALAAYIGTRTTRQVHSHLQKWRERLPVTYCRKKNIKPQQQNITLCCMEELGAEELESAALQLLTDNGDFSQ